jgi:glycosyltransferase involved in cell wall biosynthesis
VPLVSDSELRAYYRAADLFVCASEHEGFCVPIAEAMAFGVPALALNRCAVGETVGEAGLLVDDWNDEQVAALAAHLVESPARRDHIVHVQQTRLSAFSPATITEHLRAVVHFLRDGHSSPLFTRAEPTPVSA